MKLTAKFVVQDQYAPIEFQLSPDTTIEKLKQLIVSRWAGINHVSALRMVFGGKAVGEKPGEEGQDGMMTIGQVFPEGATVHCLTRTPTMANEAAQKNTESAAPPQSSFYNKALAALMEAIDHRNTHQVQTLLYNGVICKAVNLWTPDRITPLMRACEVGSVSIVRLLIEAGANVDMMRATDGLTAVQIVRKQREVGLIQPDTAHRLLSLLKCKDWVSAPDPIPYIPENPPSQQTQSQHQRGGGIRAIPPSRLFMTTDLSKPNHLNAYDMDVDP